MNEWRVTRVGTLRSPLSPAAGYAAVQQALCARCATYAIVNAPQPREHVPPHFNRPKALPARLFNAIPPNRNNESYPLTIDAFVFIQNGIIWNRMKANFSTVSKENVQWYKRTDLVLVDFEENPMTMSAIHF